MVKINIELGEELHRALRVKAIKEGTTMADAVVNAIKNYVGENTNGKE